MTEKIVLVLLFGGRSSEHSISCATAGGVLAAIDRTRFDVIPVGITRDGAFTLQDDDSRAFTLNTDAMPAVRDNGTRVRWPENAVDHTLTVCEANGIERSLGEIDVVFPILHGPWGEDGTVQGMLELIDLPYVGSGVLASALGMDKHFTKTILNSVDVPVAPWITATAVGWRTDPERVRSDAHYLGYPQFVKPARAGSSVGVSKVSEPGELDAAIEVALAEDGKVLVEAALVGRELEIGVLGGHPGEPSRASVAGEIVVNGRDFYDYEAKYLGAPGIDLACPANLTGDELSTMQALAIRAFDAIGGQGLARVDFFLTADGFVINEINTMPGFTPISMFPKCWEASGLTYPDLISELIDLALTAV